MKGYKQFSQMVLITAVIILGILLISYKVEQNAHRRANLLERDLKTTAAYELGKEVQQRVKMTLDNRTTFDEFTEAFGMPTELENKSDPEYADFTHSFFHDGSQRMFYLKFSNEGFERYSSHHSISDIKTGVVLETPAFLRTELIRESVLLVSLIVWFLMLLFVFISRKHRIISAVLLTVLSTVCGICWFLSPNYSPTLQGISSNDNLVLFLIMIVVSLCFVAVTLTRPSGECPESITKQ